MRNYTIRVPDDLPSVELAITYVARTKLTDNYTILVTEPLRSWRYSGSPFVFPSIPENAKGHLVIDGNIKFCLGNYNFATWCITPFWNYKNLTIKSVQFGNLLAFFQNDPFIVFLKDASATFEGCAFGSSNAEEVIVAGTGKCVFKRCLFYLISNILYRGKADFYNCFFLYINTYYMNFLNLQESDFINNTFIFFSGTSRIKIDKGRFINNIIWYAGSPGYVQVGDEVVCFNNNLYQYTGFPCLHFKTDCSFCKDNTAVDPLFEVYDEPKLSSTSPMIDTGFKLEESYTRDIYNRKVPSGFGFDKGCAEYSLVGTCTTGCEVEKQYVCTDICEAFCQLSCEGGCQFYCEGPNCETICETACERNCENYCETICEINCDSSCQSGCQISCQTNCEESAEPVACDISCQLFCEYNCEESCQAYCQETCQISVQDTPSCAYECETYCQVSCESFCETLCEYSCEMFCQDYCQEVCETLCQNICQIGCEQGCESFCETSCQLTCESFEQSLDLYRFIPQVIKIKDMNI